MIPALLLTLQLGAASAWANPEGGAPAGHEAPAAGHEAPAAGHEAPAAAGHEAPAADHAAAGAHGGDAHASGGHDGGGHEAPVDFGAIAIALVNVLLFAGVMWYFAGRPVGDALKNRALAVRSGLDEASKMKADAEARFADVKAKLDALGRQVEEMKAESRVAAEKEAQALTERADADAARMMDAAERSIREETTRATGIIRGEAAALAVQLAKDILRKEVNRDDQERLARQFLTAVAAGNTKEADHG